MGSLGVLLGAFALPVLLAADGMPLIGVPSTTMPPDEEEALPHVHEVVLDLGPRPGRDVRVVIELSGARRPARAARRFAAGAMSVAAGLVGGAAAGIIPPLADSMAQGLAGEGDRAFAVRGRSLRSLGGGLRVLRFRCVHDPRPGGGGNPAAVRVSVHARGVRTIGPWQPLEGSPSALSSSQLP